METELKLVASPAQVHKIASQRLLQDFSASEPVTRQLTSHYFDTPDTALHKVGLSLRVREDAQQRTQTLKTASAVTSPAGPLQRGEWEAPADSSTPDLRALRKARKLPREVAKALRQAGRRGQLAEQFTVQAQRTTWMLDVDGASIELALDEGAALANGASSTFTEIELEHKSGKKSALYTAAHALARHIPVQVSFVTKAERGFALLGEGMRPRKTSAIAFPRRATVEQDMRRILAACLAHAQSNAQGFLDSDPEYLHQLRVGMRRFRSALKLFRDLVALPPDLQQQLDATSTLLGAARDADVLVLTTLPRIRDAGHHGAFLQPLFDHADAYAAGQRASAREAIYSTHHAQMMLALFEWVDGRLWRKDAPRAARARLRKLLVGYARHAIRDAHDVVMRRTRTVEKRGRDSTTLHRLRIACKQARYAVEFFAGIARPRKAKRYVKQLSAAQDTLGTLNDMHVARTILPRFADADAGLVPAVAVVTAYLHGIAAAQLHRPQAPWRQLAHASVHGLVRKGGR